MENIVEIANTWMKSQKEFMESWVNSQRRFMENWAEATKIMQTSLLNMGGPQEGATKEIFNLYKSALTTMVDSSKVLTDEAEKIQETLKSTAEKQMDMGREMVKNLSGLFTKAA